jgi:hypothetical protein
MRYNPGPTTHTKRPGNKEKLPAGAFYMCSAEGGKVGLLDDMGDTGDSDELSLEEERSRTVWKIIKRLSRKRPCQVEENERRRRMMLKRFLRLIVTTIRTWSTFRQRSIRLYWYHMSENIGEWGLKKKTIKICLKFEDHKEFCL